MAHQVLEDGKEQMTLTILTRQMASGVSSGQHCTCLYIHPSQQEGWVPLQKRRGHQPRTPPALTKLAANTGSCFKWSQAACDLLCPAHSDWHHDFKVIHVVLCVRIFSHFKANEHCIYGYIHPHDDGHRLLPHLATVNATAMDGVCQYLLKPRLHFLWVHSQVLLLEWLDLSHPLVCLGSHFLWLLLCRGSSWVLTWPAAAALTRLGNCFFPPQAVVIRTDDRWPGWQAQAGTESLRDGSTLWLQPDALWEWVLCPGLLWLWFSPPHWCHS